MREFISLFELFFIKSQFKTNSKKRAEESYQVAKIKIHRHFRFKGERE